MSTKNDKQTNEQLVTQDWSDLINQKHQPTLTKIQVVPLDEAWTIDHMLTQSECEALIQRANEVGFGKGAYSPFYRNNLRLRIISPELSEVIWERIQHVFQEPLIFRQKKFPQWKAVGLNSMWRLSKYYPNNFFKQHIDDYYATPDGKQHSLLTLNIYLNDHHACTRFYLKKGIERVHPKAGRALVFRQAPEAEYLHAGEKVVADIKYLMRSDIMFSLIDEEKKN